MGEWLQDDSRGFDSYSDEEIEELVSHYCSNNSDLWTVDCAEYIFNFVKISNAACRFFSKN